MHSYLKSIGFSNINTRTDFERFLKIIMESPDSKYVLEHKQDHDVVQFNKKIADNLGLSVIGEVSGNNTFYLTHYAPYALSDIVSSTETVSFNQRIDSDAYTGMCDDMRLGISLIFYLINTHEYILGNYRQSTEKPVDVCLAALALEGKILLGVSNETEYQRRSLADAKKRSHLIAEARKGNQEAIESLTIDEIDVNSMISRRSKTEDIYTIVENSFIPYGSESDNYSLLGTITKCELISNRFTGEEIYYLLINCNEIVFPVYINRADLFGTPMVGRRFKGVIWMQGKVDFADV